MNIMDIATVVENTFVNAFQGAENALVDFVTTGKADFKSLVDSIMADLARLLIRQSLMGLFGLFGPSPSTGGGGILPSAGSHLGLGGYQTGGSFRVGGSGGPDSQLVAFRASPGESVAISRPNQTPNVDVAAPELKVRIVNSMDPNIALDALSSAQGERIIMNTIKRNPKAISRILGG